MPTPDPVQEVDVFDDESDESLEEQDFPPTSITISTNVHEVGGTGVKNKVELSLCASMVSSLSFLLVFGSQNFRKSNAKCSYLEHESRFETTNHSL